MKIKSIEMLSFGKFKNKTVTFDEGLNIIFGNNESGKSTIISFIYAMLYGFGDNRGKAISLRDKYTPWSGGECEGKLNLVCEDGTPVTIYRKAGNVKKYDTLKIYNTETAEELNIDSGDIAKVSSETFLKTLCIKQLSSSFEGGNSEIVTRLANIASGGDEAVSYEKAVKIIESARREIKPLRGNGGTLNALNNEILALERTKAEQKEIESRLTDVMRRLPLSEKDAQKAENEYEKLLKTSYDAEIANIKGRISEKEAYIEKNRKSPRSKAPYITAAALFAVLSAIMLISGMSLWFLPLIGAIAVIIPLFMDKKPATDDTELSELASLQSELGKKEKAKAAHEATISIAKENALSSRRNLEALNLHKTALESKMTATDSTVLATLYEKRDILQSDYSVLTLAFEALESSHTKMQRDFTPALNKRASEYFKALTGEKYEKIFCDEEFNLRIEADIPRDSTFFSGGTVDQLYLALRLGLIDMLFENEPVFILLDEPFLQYDKLRTENALKLLNALSKNRQFILFTANEKDFSVNKNIEILT